jgi:hypothetical protein
MLSELLGKKRFHGACGHLPPRVWRTQLTHIFRTLRKAAHGSLHGDRKHRDVIDARCNSAVKCLGDCKNTDELSAAAIRHLAQIVFLVMGEWPNNWHKSASAAAHPQNWSLTRLRSLHYLRSPDQLFQEILDLTELPGYKKILPTKGELWDRLSRVHKGDYEAFLDWFKVEHPRVYIDLV